MQERSLGAGPRHMESYRHALDAGVEVLLGSDMPPFWNFEGTSAVVRELEHMQAGGLAASDVIRAATAAPARWLDADDRVGTIAVGPVRRPHRDARRPCRGVAALRGIEFVMKGGVVVRDDAGVQKRGRHDERRFCGAEAFRLAPLAQRPRASAPSLASRPAPSCTT